MTDKQLEEKKKEFMEISSLIRSQRRYLGESQRIYGKRFGVGGTTVSEWEVGRSVPKYPTLSIIQWQWISKLVEEVERENKADLMFKLNSLYSKFEQEIPPTGEYNEGLYEGLLKAMEITVNELLGFDGDQLREKAEKI